MTEPYTIALDTIAALIAVAWNVALGLVSSIGDGPKYLKAWIVIGLFSSLPAIYFAFRLYSEVYS